MHLVDKSVTSNSQNKNIPPGNNNGKLAIGFTCPAVIQKGLFIFKDLVVRSLKSDNF